MTSSAHGQNYHVDINIPIVMRDGAVLRADVYRCLLYTS